MNWVLLRNSLLVGVFATLLSISFGFLSALWLAGLPGRLRSVWLGAAVLALALPPFLVTNTWLDLLNATGPWHQWVPLNIFSLGGAVWVLSMLLWPLTLFLVWGAWQQLEPAQLESDLLVQGWALVRVLLFPLARQALVLAALLTLVLALNNFSVPAILQVKVLPAEMWIRFNTELDTLGALRAACPLFIAPLFVMVWFSRREVSWPHREAPISGSLFRRQLGPAWFWPSGVCACVLLGCSVILPLYQILSAPRTWSELPGALAAGQNAVWNSLCYAGAAASAITITSLALATLKRRNPNVGSYDAAQSAQRGLALWGFLRIFCAAALWLAFLLPGVLLGIALIHLFNHNWSALIYQSAGIVILAFVIRYALLGWQTVSRAGRRVDRDLLDVALLAGAAPWQRLRHVYWPQIARQVCVAWYLVFLLCLWDVESMILVVPPGGETLALRIFNLLHYGHNAQVNALCFALLVVALLPLLVAQAASRALRWGRSLTASLRLRDDKSHAASPTALAVTLGTMLLLTACAPKSNTSALSSKFFDAVQTIGSRGVGVGQLNKPRSVAVDANDNLYVVDMTGRVQKFSSNGVFLLSWQMPQTDLGKPKGMTHDLDGNIIVLEPHYSRVNLFSPMGTLLRQWGSHGTNTGQLSMPRAVAVDSRRGVFVSEYQGIERVQKFVFDHGSPGSAPEAAGLGWKSPRCTEVIGHAGTGPGEFNRPEGLCVDRQDRLYVADSCNHRIQVFDSDGRFLRAYGKAGRGPGELSYPYDICVDQEGRQYVCEFGNSRIQVFDAQDKSIEIIGGPGAQPGRFGNPWGLALDSAENLYVADSQNHRVQKLMRRR